MELIDKLEKNIEVLATELQALRKENEHLRNTKAESSLLHAQNYEHTSSSLVDDDVKKEALSRVDALLATVQSRLIQKNTSL